jgi:hypothetical protein
MNLSWFDDWRFDLRRRAAFHETAGVPRPPEPLIIKERPQGLHGK